MKLLGGGYSADEIVREYPGLENQDVYQTAKYGAWLAVGKTSASMKSFRPHPGIGK